MFLDGQLLDEGQQATWYAGGSLQPTAATLLRLEMTDPPPEGGVYYCLGFAALELLAGEKFERLFGVADGANWLAWHADPYKQLVDWQPALSHAPAGLLEVIAGLIAKRPGERQSTTAGQLKAGSSAGGSRRTRCSGRTDPASA